MTRPTVTAVVPTHDRPELLRRAIRRIREQRYDGLVECVVVFDKSDPDPSLEVSGDRPVRVLRNDRTPGLAGGRNTGILAATTDYVGFCDDDDEWLPGKVEAQMRALEALPAAHAATCGVEIRYGDRTTERIPEPERLTVEGFVEDRMPEVGSNTLLFERRWLIDEVGLVDEKLPGSYGEDYDLVLRSARLAPFAVATAPHAVIWWHKQSFFADRWRMIDDALEYLLDKHPEFSASPRGYARIRGQQAVARAALGERRRAFRTIREVARANPLDRRIPLATAIALGLLRPDRAINLAHRFGRGL
ncbi:MAG: glycosyltransferase family 2 protein [Actinomycetota bacterium]